MNKTRATAATLCAILLTIASARWHQVKHTSHIAVLPEATQQALLKKHSNPLPNSLANNHRDYIPPPVADDTLRQLLATKDSKLTAERARYQPNTTRRSISRASHYQSDEIDIPLHSKVNAALSVDVDHRAITKLNTGDIATIGLPNGSEMEILIISTRPTASGARVLTGLAVASDDQTPVVITSSEQFTSATIPTAAGEYILEALNGRGWVYEPPPLHELVPDNRSDALVPGSEPS